MHSQKSHRIKYSNKLVCKKLQWTANIEYVQFYDYYYRFLFCASFGVLNNDAFAGIGRLIIAYHYICIYDKTQHWIFILVFMFYKYHIITNIQYSFDGSFLL